MSREDQRPPPASRPTALIVAPRGAFRTRLEGLLEGLGYEAISADEPYAATDRFAEVQAELVVASLEVFHPRDRGFFQAVRRRSPATRVVVLVREGERARARVALKAGASFSLPYPEQDVEWLGLARALQPPGAIPGAAGRAMLSRLAEEWNHAVRNPLQVVRLLADDPNLPDKTRPSLVRAVEDIQDGLARLRRIATMPPREARRVRLGSCLAAGLAPLVEQGRVKAPDPPLRPGPLITADEAALALAFEAAADALAGSLPVQEKGGAPVVVEARIGRPRPDPLGLLSDRAAPAVVEARLRVPGLDLTRRGFEELAEHVLWRSDDRRAVHWGLWLPRELVRAEGGVLLHRRRTGGGGVAVAFRLR